MKITVLIFTFGLPLLFLALAAAIKFGKAYWLIAGYNTASPEERAKVDVKRLGNILSLMLAGIAVCCAAGMTLLYFKKNVAGLVAMLLMLPVIAAGVALCQTCNGDTAGKKVNRGALIAAIAVPLLLGAIVLVPLMIISQPAGVTVGDGSVILSGYRSRAVDLRDIKSASLLETMPEVNGKIKGLDFGNRLKGDFDVKGLGETQLYVDTARPPYVLLRLKTGDIYLFSAPTADATRDVYREIVSALQKGGAG